MFCHGIEGEESEEAEPVRRRGIRNHFHDEARRRNANGIVLSCSWFLSEEFE